MQRRKCNRRALEPLEDRRLFALLGVIGSAEAPLITYDSTGALTYNAGTQAFDADATPLTFTESFFPPSPTRLITAPADLQLHIQVDNTGNLVGGVPGDDLVITGNVDIDGNGSIDASGTLLTGEVLGFGFLDGAGLVDQYDYRFRPTGGALQAAYFTGKDIGITMVSEHSSFANNFAVDFSGGAKGNVFAISQPRGSISWEKRTDAAPFPLLGGATFVISPDPIDGVGTLTVVDNGANDANPVPGQILVNNVILGMYTITETAAPAGFLPDDDPTRVVTVSEGDLNAVIGTQGQDDPGNSDESDFHNRAREIIVTPDKCNCAPPFVHVVNAATGELVSRFLAYEPTYRGGVRVATGDLNGDGIDEIVTAPGRNHSPLVKVFNQSGNLLYSFLAYSSKFLGGVDVAVGDVNGDGKNDVVTAMTYNGNQVKVFKNVSAGPAPFTPLQLAAFSSFYPFGSVFKGGATVEAADLGQPVTVGGVKKLDPSILDGRAEIIVGSGSGMPATIKIFTYFGSSSTATLVRTLLPFGFAFRGGVSLDVARVNADLVPDIVVAAGNGGNSQVLILNGITGTTLSGFTAYAPPDAPSANAPVHVAAFDSNGDGIAEFILTVQGSDGATRKIRKFEALSGQLVDEVMESTADFCGAYFLAALNSRPPG
jgi:VCBS repeat protein/prealbumin domain-containing protein